MGAYRSKLSPEEIEELQTNTHCRHYLNPNIHPASLSLRLPVLLTLSSLSLSPFSLPSVSVREVESLYRRFKKLDRKRGGSITREDFHLIPELSMNPLCDRLIALFDPSQSDAVTFDLFVHTVHLFSPHANPHDRVRAIFNLYDVDGDGKIAAEDLQAILRLLVGDNIDEETLRAIVRQTLEECGKVGSEAAVTLEDFDSILGPDIASLTIPIHTPDY